MKTKVRSTSLDAYKSILPMMGALEQKVFGTIRFYYSKNNRWPSDKEILETISIYDRTKKWAISDVTARRNGLVKKNLVIDGPHTYDRLTGRKVTTWKINIT